MKKITLMIFLQLFLCLPSNASSLIPLEKYCKDHDLKKDNFALGYVTLRCGSLFPYIAGIIDKRIGKNENVQQKNDAVKSYLKLVSKQIGYTFQNEIYRCSVRLVNINAEKQL